MEGLLGCKLLDTSRGLEFHKVESRSSASKIIWPLLVLLLYSIEVLPIIRGILYRSIDSGPRKTFLERLRAPMPERFEARHAGCLGPGECFLAVWSWWDFVSQNI